MPNKILLNSLNLARTIANANIIQLLAIRKAIRKESKWKMKAHKLKTK